MISALVSNRWSLGYPFTYRGIEFAFTFLTGSYNVAIDRYQTIGEGILKTGIFSALLAFQKPISLICLLNRIADGLWDCIILFEAW